MEGRQRFSLQISGEEIVLKQDEPKSVWSSVKCYEVQRQAKLLTAALR
jgi:hypothetical protein